ncbi:uncharacterized protein LOC127582491 [Pristis pectinata]|uniref:uncharacterized protein LOC127582491 n=1 Tax=Pristis pectinata TaxID=685728 RepID=UPI00223DA49F|nr:uncharacterized protein LOC127582491 [Pristis pectinata]XP_051893755.1 uncharacterized protein LOC127582491 [Pristis pectinata]
MLSQLETAMDAIIKVFHKYSGKEGDKYTLSRSTLKDLLNEEFKNFLKEQQYSKNVDNFMTELQCDNQVNFKEFMGLVTAITITWKGFLDDHWKKQWMGQPTVNSKMLSQLETAMDTTIKVFSKYSGKEGDKYTLTKAELKDLLKKELKSFLENQDKSVDKFMTELTCDEQVDFKEFMRLVTAIAIECNVFPTLRCGTSMDCVII